MNQSMSPSLCPYCAASHGGMCPRVRSIAYAENGDVQHVQFFSPHDLAVPAPCSYRYGEAAPAAAELAAGSVSAMNVSAANLSAPRVTPQDIEAEISAEFYFTASDGVDGATDFGRKGYEWPYTVRHDDNVAEPHLRRLTFCVLILRNGFIAAGESACVSSENFDAEIERKIARENAVNKTRDRLNGGA